MGNKLRTSGYTPEKPAQQLKGVFDRNPSPGLKDYPADVGPNDIHMKFAESGVGDASMQTNKMRQQDPKVGRKIAPVATTSNMKKGPNQVRKQGKPKQFSGKS